MWCSVDGGGQRPMRVASPTRPRCTGADAALALGMSEYALDPDIAADAVDRVDGIAWRRADEQAAAEIRGPVTDLLLAIYRRRPVSGLDVTGDATLVDFWLERVAFG